MPLGRLNTVIRQVVKRLEYEPYMKEMAVRYAFIDPILRALDWDTENPNQVTPEYGTGPIYDYLLLYGEKRRVVVEAKMRGYRFNRVDIDSRIEKCQQWGIPYLAYTNGVRWQIYDVRKIKCLVDIDIRGKPADVVSQLILLWRPSMSLEIANRSRLVKQPEGEVKVIQIKPRDMNRLIESNVLNYLEPDGNLPKYVALHVTKPVNAIQYWGSVENGEKSTEAIRATVKHGNLWSLAKPIKNDYTDLGQGFSTSMSKLSKAINFKDLT